MGLCPERKDTMGPGRDKGSATEGEVRPREPRSSFPIHRDAKLCFGWCLVSSGRAEVGLRTERLWIFGGYAKLEAKWLGQWAGCGEKGEVPVIHSSKNPGEPGTGRFMSCGLV